MTSKDILENEKLMLINALDDFRVDILRCDGATDIRKVLFDLKDYVCQKAIPRNDHLKGFLEEKKKFDPDPAKDEEERE